MRGGKNKTGYTITEVLIVLAISSAMFIAANAFLSGRVAETNFRTGTNEMASRLQDTINQVSSGQYSDIPNRNCVIASGVPSFDIPLVDQGKNINCIFIGKFFTFSNASNTYTTQLVAGKRESTNFTDVSPTIITNTVTNFNIPGGLKYKAIAGQPTSFAIIQNPAGSSPSDATANSVLLTNSAMNATLSNIQLCLSDGNRSSIITIGDNNNLLGVKTEYKYGSADCT